MEFVKWWKNKLVVALMCTAIGSVIIAFLFAYFISWGWILSIVTAIVGGLIMRRIIVKLIEKEFEKLNKQ